jgi:aspartate/methionine/tyrosine aminotransferase
MLAMPQLKIAWIFSVGKLSQSKEIQQNLLWIADTYLSVSSFSQEFFIKIFPWRKMIQNQIKNRLSRNIHSINTSLRDQNNISCIDTKACWSVVLTYNGSKFSSGIEWSDYLFKNQNIKIYPGEFFHYQNGKHIILSLILEEQKVVLGMERIIQSIKS